MMGSLKAKVMAGLAGILGVAGACAAASLAPPGWLGGGGARAGILALLLAVAAGIAIAVWRAVLIPLTAVLGTLDAWTREATALDTIAKAQSKLDANLGLLRDLLYGKGDPHVVDGTLYFGDYAVATNDIVDVVQATHGGSATIFLGDLRVSTTIKDPSGKRQIGTRLAQGPAHETTLKQGRSYRGEADIFGEV